MAAFPLSAGAVAAADETEPSATFQNYDPADFSAAAAALPQDLAQALHRDLGTDAATYLADAAAARSAAEVVRSLRETGVGVESAQVDGQELTIYLSTAEDAAAVEATGASAVVGSPPTADGLTSRDLRPQEDLRGGLGYATVDDVGNPTSASRCSVGFNGTDTGGAPLFLTAGHCGHTYAAGHPWFYLDVDSPLFDDPDWVGPELLENPIGVNGPHHLGLGADAGLVEITEPGWTTPPQVSNWGGGEGGPDDGAVDVYDSTDPIVGQPVCKSGATSGWTCGEVLYAQDNVVIGDDPDAYVTGFIFNACMLAGDSGGPIVSGNYALGVNSFSSASSAAGCDTPNWIPATTYEPGGFADGDVSGGFGLLASPTSVRTIFGADFRLDIHVGSPLVTLPEAGGTTHSKPTFSGTIEAAAGAVITVSVDGQPWATGIVEADGTWAASPFGSPLALGSHEYEVYAEVSRNGDVSDIVTSPSATGTCSVEETVAADLVVLSPIDDAAVDGPRPVVSGTGQPGATVELGAAQGDGEGLSLDASVEVAADGTWSATPGFDLPFLGERFDLIVFQDYLDTSQRAAVSGVGIKAPPATISSPAADAEVDPSVVFSGTSAYGTEVGLTLTGPDGNWQGTAAVEDGQWNLAPESLTGGAHTLAVRALVAGDPALDSDVREVSFTVVGASADSGDDPGDDGDSGGSDNPSEEAGGDDLPDTGVDPALAALTGAVLLVAGGLVVTRRKAVG